MSKEEQIVTFSVGAEELGLLINDVREIIKIPQVTPLPNAPPYIVGVINLRGKIIPVIDLAEKMHIHSGKKTHSRIIIVELEGSSAGLVVDTASEVLRIKESDIDKTPDIIKKEIDSNFIKGVAIIEERLIIIVNLAYLIDIQEIKNVNNNG